MRSKSPANSAASSPPVPARTSSIAARSSAEVLGQQLQRQRALGVGQLLLDLGQFLLGHRAHVLVGIAGHGVEAVALGAKPSDFTRGRSDRLDLRIFLGQANEFVGRQIGRRHRGGDVMPLRLDRDDLVERDGVHGFVDSIADRIGSALDGPLDL